MHIGLLGGLEVVDDDGQEIVVAGAKQRALLALLALHVGRVVPTEQLVDALWGDDPPAAVRNSLQGLTSKLRRTLGSADLVAMRGGGYVLELPPEAIDVHRFEGLVAEGRAAAADDPDRAVRRLAEADALWRGDPLADFTYEDFALAGITRLSELRLAVIEERLDLELQLGRHASVIVPLEELVTAHPLRERLRGLLMIALYRAGRQADALRTFQEGRQVLGEELGLEPGHELRELEAAILAQDRSLDAPTVVPPVVRPDARSTIPESLTPLVGRDEERRELTELFAQHRFVTLVGPGGVGKTRLALEVAHAASRARPLGACLVELAPVGDPAGVSGAIAAALELPDPDRLVEVIGERDLLLVLDNCEHVITAAAEVAEDLLGHCPGLRLLATSREGLRIGGEIIWPVPPLPAADAVQLFLARATAAGASVEVTTGAHAVISEICTRLDGLPLAIELAAARTRAFPIAQIAERLNDRFRLLTGGSRTALPRQQTLQAVVDWSYDLLFEDEQRVFERLSVLPGGCDLATAEAVCADEVIAVGDVADHLHTLVEKSLVVAVPVAGGLRFTQLQTLAQYGRERLTERGDAVRIRDAMARHFAVLCSRSAAAYIGDEQRTWLTAMDQEHDNLRAALDWAVANDDAETALMIAGGAAWPHWLTGMVAEGRRWLDDAFACAGDADERTRALALTGRGLLDFLAGASENSDEDLATALEIFERHGDAESMALANSFYAEQAAVRGDLDEARRRRQVVLDFYGESPEDPFAAAARRYSEAKLAILNGDLVEAERHYRAATEGFGRLDRPVMNSMCLGMVADFDERAGDYAAAITTLEAAIATNESLLGGFTGSLQSRLGWVLLHDGQLQRAEAVCEGALESARRVHHTMVIFQAQAGLAALHRLHGRGDVAVEAGTEALDLYRADGFRRFRNRVDPQTDLQAAAAVCCEVLGAIASERDDPERAARLLGRADHLRAASGVEVPGFLVEDARTARERAIEALGPDAFHAAVDQGRHGADGLPAA